MDKSMKRLIGVVIACMAGWVWSSPTMASIHKIDQKAIERVGSIRASLMARDAEIRGSLGETELTQWYNWPNWGNWGNWPNWLNRWSNY